VDAAGTIVAEATPIAGPKGEAEAGRG
jgi:hypothetical protein